MNADNSAVVATDTMKNTINVLAHQDLGQSIEPFALSVAEHFLKKYPHVSSVTVEIAERVWHSNDSEEFPHTLRTAPNV